MERSIAEIMLTGFAQVASNDTVATAEALIESEGCEAVPVTNPDGSLFGLLLPHHLLHFHRRPGANAHATLAWEICDMRPLVVSPLAALEDVAFAMLDTRRPLAVVVDEQLRPRGLVSSHGLLQVNFPPRDDSASRPSRRR